MLKIAEIGSCHIGPDIIPGQFIAEHFFIYLIKGTMTGYDGNKKYILKKEEACVVRKNHVVQLSNLEDSKSFTRIIVVLDEQFLRNYKVKYNIKTTPSKYSGAFVHLKGNRILKNFARSLVPYYNKEGKIDPAFADAKRNELLLILHHLQPDLDNILFNFRKPRKKNPEHSLFDSHTDH